VNEPKNYKFHSTGQFRNAVKNIKHQASFDGMDGDGNPIYNPLAEMPVITFTGTVKLNGTNASIVLDENGIVSFHSKTIFLGM